MLTSSLPLLLPMAVVIVVVVAYRRDLYRWFAPVLTVGRVLFWLWAVFALLWCIWTYHEAYRCNPWCELQPTWALIIVAVAIPAVLFGVGWVILWTIRTVCVRRRR